MNKFYVLAGFAVLAGFLFGWSTGKNAGYEVGYLDGTNGTYGNLKSSVKILPSL